MAQARAAAQAVKARARACGRVRTDSGDSGCGKERT